MARRHRWRKRRVRRGRGLPETPKAGPHQRFGQPEAQRPVPHERPRLEPAQTPSRTMAPPSGTQRLIMTFASEVVARRSCQVSA